ncbi:MAG: O-antigen ligase family protein [Geminicoccaceae bacterium]
MASNPAMQGLILPRTSWLEQAYVVLTFLVSAGGLNGLFIGNATESLNDSNSLRLGVALALYLIAAGLLLQRHAPRLVALTARQWGLALLLLYILASCIWSTETVPTFRRSMAFCLSTVFCAYVVLEYDLRRIIRLIAVATFIFACISLLNLASNPGELISDDARKYGAWTNGITGLTFFGRVMAISTLVFWFAKNDHGPWRLFGWFGFLLSFFMLIKIQAATATIAVIVTLGAIIGLEIVRRYRFSLSTFLIIGLAISLPLLGVFIFAADVFFEAIGRDPTLTNRTRIWSVATTFAMEHHPWLGSGFRAFWTDSHSALVRFLIYGSRHTDYGNGHSGYVDIWLELGVPGAVGVALILITALWRGFYLLLYHPDDHVVFFPAFMIFILIYNFPEKVFLEHTDIASMTFLVVILKMAWLCALRDDSTRVAVGGGTRLPYQLVTKAYEIAQR